MEEQIRKKERAVLAGLAAASMDEHERSTDVSMEELARQRAEEAARVENGTPFDKDLF